MTLDCLQMRRLPGEGLRWREVRSRGKEILFVSAKIKQGGFSPSPSSPIPAIRGPGQATTSNRSPLPVLPGPPGSSSSSTPSPSLSPALSSNLIASPQLTSPEQKPSMVAPAVAPAASRSQSTLSREWVEKYSQQHKRKFWKNQITGKSTWEDPFAQGNLLGTRGETFTNLAVVKSETDEESSGLL